MVEDNYMYLVLVGQSFLADDADGSRRAIVCSPSQGHVCGSCHASETPEEGDDGLPL